MPSGLVPCPPRPRRARPAPLSGRRHAGLPIIALALLLAACGDTSGPAERRAGPARLGLVTPAAGAACGAAFTTQPVVEIVDEHGNRTASDAVVTMTVGIMSAGTPGTPRLFGGTEVKAVRGVATFANTGLEAFADRYLLAFTSPELSPASQQIEAGPGPAAGVLLATAAAGASAGQAFAVQPVAVMGDFCGNALSVDGVPVTLTVTTGATVTGTTTVVTTGGAASFVDAGLSGPAGLYTLTYSSLAFPLTASQAIGLDWLPGRAQTVIARIYHTAALSTDGAYWQWGEGTTRPRRLDAWPRMRTITGGVMFGCGLADAGTAYCWGRNEHGYVGDGTTTVRLAPTPVAGGHTFSTITSGNAHSCGVTAAGTAYCWGWNSTGSLGDGTRIDRLVPTPVAGGLTFTSIDAYSARTCALTADGAAYCWGGRAGDGTAVQRDVPTRVAGEHAFTQIAAGGGHSCGLTADGAAYCWGTNASGSVGDGTTAERLEPVPVAGGLTFASISAGGGHTCALTAAGAPYCWGWNEYGQVGDGTTADRPAPVPVAGGLTFATLSASGWMHTCGATRDGVVYCWGNNEHGRLGDGTTVTRLAPTRTAEWAPGGSH
jgi:hypothetical protein